LVVVPQKKVLLWQLQLGSYVVLSRWGRWIKERFRKFVEKPREKKSGDNRAGGIIK